MQQFEGALARAIVAAAELATATTGAVVRRRADGGAMRELGPGLGTLWTAPHREIVAALHISPSCLSKWSRHERETGSLQPAQIGGYKPRNLSGDCAEWLRERVASGPVTLRGLTAELAERGIKTQPRAVWVFLHAEGLSFKKTLFPQGQTRSDIACKRERWKRHQGLIAPSRLVFIDETWVKTNMAPLRGWGP